MRLTNRLDAPTTLHVNGWRGANALDGAAGLTGDPVPSGGSAELALTPPDAGLFTFGPLVPATAAEQAGRGLGGLLLVAGPGEPEVDEEVVVALRDWRLTPEDAIEGGFERPEPRVRAGRLGNLVTVDNAPGPRRESFTPGARIRLRVASLAPARTMPLRITGCRATIVGVSGHVSEPFVPLRGEMTLVPGGRYDLVVDLPREPGQEARLTLALGEGSDLLVLRTADAPPRPARGPVPSLPPADLPDRIDLGRARRETLRLEAPSPEALAGLRPDRLWRLNGRPGGFEGPPAFSVKRGAPVVIAFENRAAVPVVMAVHGHALRILHPRDDGWEPYWLDAILVPAGGTERCAFVASNPGRWALRSRNLDHLAGGLFTWFEVG